MSRTKIFLPSSGSIDMYDDVSTPLNFSIADIRFPDKRNSNYSKTIKIPGTKNNNLLFGNIFDVNVTDGSFNPNAKVKGILTIDDENQINGYIQMLSITINDDSKIEYEVMILGNVGNIFNALGTAELTALDLSDYDHTYDYATQVASWTNDYTDGYCYPLIEYGYDNDLTKVNVEHLFPSVFLRTYIDAIFQSVGYTYSSTFFDSEYFKKLIVPANAGKVILTDAQIAPRLYEATQTVQSSGTIESVYDSFFNQWKATFAKQDIIYNNEITDVSGQYNPATGEWTVAETGYYSLGANGSANVSFLSTATSLSAFLNFEWKPYYGSTYSTIGSGYGVLVTGANTLYVGLTNIFFTAGDKVKVTLAAQSAFTLTETDGALTFNGGTFKNQVVNSGLIDGDNITINQVTPLKIKQKDFLLSVIKMFNLYIDIDPNNENNLLIETRDDFYSSGTNVDWSYKLDNSKPIDIKPMGDLDNKEFNFTYTDDTDYFNKKYKDGYAETYGRFRYVTDNEFLKGTSENKVIFSPTPLIGDTGSDRVISRIWDVDSSNIVKSKAFNIRLLYNGGVKTSNVAYQYNGRISGVHTVTQYLYAGHVDNPTNPTLDLSFGVPQEIYYDTELYTNNNIFNRFHKKLIDEITDRDSKIFTAYFYLRPSDVRTLDFRNQFYFQNDYFRLNKVFDYDPLKNDVTKCEFIKVKDAGTFSPTVHTLLGGISSAFGESNEIPPIINTWNASTVDNIRITGGARAMTGGTDNIYGDNVRSCIVNGDSNVIGDSENVTLLGSSGCIVGSGIINVTLINTFDTEITESNSMYINGVVLNEDSLNQTSTITIPSADVLTLFTTPYLLIPSPGAGYYIQVLTAACKVNFNSVAYATSTTLNIYTDTATRVQHVFSNALNATLSRIGVSAQQGVSAAADTQLISNKGIYLQAQTTNPTLGNSDIIIYLTYRIIQE
jgi:hypothetical protein